MGRKSAPRSIWGLVQRQHGAVSRGQLLGAGLTRNGIEHRLEIGRLRRVHAGVYAVGQLDLTREGRWMAAVLACGEGAVLSHGSAGALLRIVPRERGAIEVSVPRSNSIRRPGLRIHRPTCMYLEDRGTLRGIPVTSPVRTLIDLATFLTVRGLEAAINAADKHDLIDPETLRSALDDRHGQHGVRALREVLDPHVFVLTASELERWFLPIARRAGLPLPETGVWVNGFEVDFFWRDIGLVVETDGGRFHRTAISQTRDRKREHAHVQAGMLPLRFTHWQVRHEPARVIATLRSAASQRRAGATAA